MAAFTRVLPTSYRRLTGLLSSAPRIAQYAEGGGEMFVCPVCFTARSLAEDELLANATLAGATPLWEWIGDGATVFSY